jgi:hypothetical protein
MAKKIKKSMIEIHGRSESTQPLNTPFSLNQILGENISTYSTSSLEEYTNQLAEMNNTDLHAHAYKVGLVPVPDRKMLCERLVAEFRKWASIYSASATQQQVRQEQSLSSKAQKILREGA